MTDPVSVGVAVAAAGVASMVGWLWWPRIPELDGERWFKAAFATVLRGRVERAGGDPAAWDAAVHRFVLWNPAAREAERMVANPYNRPARASVPGELALADDIARLLDADSRWQRIQDDPVARAERVRDPVELGDKYDPATWLGYPRRPGETGWDAVAAWDGRVVAAMERVGWRTLAVEGRPRAGVPSLIPAIAGVTACDVIPWVDLDVTTAAVAAKLTEYAADPAARVIVVAEEAGAMAALRALADLPEGRDRQVAFLAIGGVLGGDPTEEGPLGAVGCADWLAGNFGHDRLDTEVVRLTPYLAVQWLDRGGTSGALPPGASRFPPPREDPGAMPMIEAVDLGMLPLDPDLPLDDVARALVVVTRCWAASRSA